MNKKNVVVIGGGQGQSCILRGIKNIDGISLTAIVTVADDGGSTGRLRKNFHIPAMGDIRNVMLSLAESESLLASLMDYRFVGISEDDILGHNLGNIILLALTNMSGNFLEAISVISKILNVKGEIIPSTIQVVNLVAKMEDDTIVVGESNIPKMRNNIKEVYYDKKVFATKNSVDRILNADYIILGIGSLFTSILPNIIIEEIKDALHNTRAEKIYYSNIMTQPGETDNYSLEDHVRMIEKHSRINIDKVIYPNDHIPESIIRNYAKQNADIVKIKEDSHNYQIESHNLLSFENNLLRHDSEKIRQSFLSIIK